MPPNASSTLATPIRLPPLRALRIRRPNRNSEGPCADALKGVLNCWASSGHTAQNCMALEQSLRFCMDSKKPTDKGKNNINFHLSRLYPKIRGPVKKDT